MTFQETSDSSPLTAQPYILNDTLYDYPIYEENYKSFLADNLESVLIGHTISTSWPPDLKSVIADTLIRGKYKYNDLETRIHRVVHHKTLTIGEIVPQAPPLLRETNDEKRAAVIYEAVLCALDHLLATKAFSTTSSEVKQLSSKAAAFSFEQSEPSHLGAIRAIVYDVATHSTRNSKDTVDILLTAITGFPCVIELMDAIIFGENHSSNVKALANVIIQKIAAHIVLAFPPIVAKPGKRWKIALLCKVAYLHKLYMRYGHHVADDTIIRTVSKIDVTHAVIETGVSLKFADKKICFVAPQSLTAAVTRSIADIYATQGDLQSENKEKISRQCFHWLCDEDRQDMEASSCHPEYGQWTTLPSGFSRAVLADFFSREDDCMDRVAANSYGDVMFLVARFGPWTSIKDVNIRSETTDQLLQQTVQGYSNNTISISSKHRLFFKKKQSVKEETIIPLDSDPDRKGHQPIDSCNYQPQTLKVIINNPNRVLIKRRGIRGNAGRLIALGILMLGGLTSGFNFAGRDNWLEIIFDGAQVMSLVATVAVAVVYVLTGTITSTLDWYGGVTEVTNEEQLASLIGVDLIEIKVACSYEKRHLFWLSNVNSCFCPAEKHGEMTFSEPLDVKLESPHLNNGCVIGKDSGLWILQGWAFRVENNYDTGHMVRSSYEDKVYVNDGDIRMFGSVVRMDSQGDAAKHNIGEDPMNVKRN